MQENMNAYKDIWCVAESRRGKIHPGVFELLTIGRKVADELGQKLCGVLMGSGVAAGAAGLAERGADRVYVVDHQVFENFVDETYGRALFELIKKHKPAKVLIPGSTWGRSVAARTAVMAGTGLASEVTGISVDQQRGSLKMTRPCYGGSMYVEAVCENARPEMATVRFGSYDRAPLQAGRKADVIEEAFDPASWASRSRYVQYQPEQSQALDLSQAEIIVSGGYGLAKPEGFKIVEELARLLGAAIGASRRVVDLGWIPYRHQVGLTGRTVKPKLYFACGISGQVQHLAGMSQSDVIVAINKDPEAPMMKLANLSVEGDLYEILPALIEEVRKIKQN